MKRFFVISAPLLMISLTACDGTLEEQFADTAVLNQRLPEGCELKFLGKARVEGEQRASRVFFTQCRKLDTITVSENNRTPDKHPTEENTVSINTFE
jgi:hypothetical protein